MVLLMYSCRGAGGSEPALVIDEISLVGVMEAQILAWDSEHAPGHQNPAVLPQTMDFVFLIGLIALHVVLIFP